MSEFLCRLAVITATCGVLSGQIHAVEDVTSREFKVMLDPARFSPQGPGSCAQAISCVEQYWAELAAAIQAPPISRTTIGALNRLPTERTVKFYDTPKTCKLQANGLIFRERIEGDSRNVTLKFRSPDRHLASYQEMIDDKTAKLEKGIDVKFEEDIAGGYVVKYSKSGKRRIGSDKNLNSMKDVFDLYPKLNATGLDSSDALRVVGDLIIREKVFEGAAVDLGDAMGDFSLTLWYGSADTSTPKAAEVSFKYKRPKDGYSLALVGNSMKTFAAMEGMNGWVVAPTAVNTKSKTKTEWAFSFDPAFCSNQRFIQD